MLDLKKMTSERGEISKSDLVVYIKQSKMWKGIMESNQFFFASDFTLDPLHDPAKIQHPKTLIT